MNPIDFGSRLGQVAQEEKSTREMTIAFRLLSGPCWCFERTEAFF